MIKQAKTTTMQIRSTLTAFAVIAMAGKSLGFNVHRHAHQMRNLEARGLHKHIDWVTVWETVTVYANENGEVKTVGPDTFFANSRPEKQDPDSYAPAELSVDSTASSAQVAPETSEAVPTTMATQVVSAESPVETEAETEAEIGDETIEPINTLAVDETPEASATPETNEVSAEVDEPSVDVAASETDTSVQDTTQVSTGGKRGFAYNDQNLVNNFASNGGNKCTWAYNWDSHHNGLTAPVDFVPMLWGDLDVHTSRWTQNADEMLSQGATHLLSFNEPDNQGQANMSPEDAARAHVEYMNPYAGKARISSPAITNSNIAGQGIEWLQEWVSACKTTGCTYDFCVAHWYAPASVSVEEVENYLRGVSEACEGKPVWLTEFAPSGSDNEISDFLTKNLANFDTLDFLERYSFFMMSVGSLMSSDSAPSSYGLTYFNS